MKYVPIKFLNVGRNTLLGHGHGLYVTSSVHAARTTHTTSTTIDTNAIPGTQIVLHGK